MNAMAMDTGGVRLNDGARMSGTLTITRNVQEVTQFTPVPDHRWRFTDAAGHRHGWAPPQEKGGHPYPTLFEIPAPECRTGGPEPCTCSEYRCRICDARIQPGLTTGPTTTYLPGAVGWSVVVDYEGVPPYMGTMMTVWFFGNNIERFGIAVVTAITSVSGDPISRVTLVAAGELGEVTR